MVFNDARQTRQSRTVALGADSIATVEPTRRELAALGRVLIDFVAPGWKPRSRLTVREAERVGACFSLLLGEPAPHGLGDYHQKAVARRRARKDLLARLRRQLHERAA